MLYVYITVYMYSKHFVYNYVQKYNFYFCEFLFCTFHFSVSQDMCDEIRLPRL